MSATLIGLMLDEALEFTRTSTPKSITIDPAKFGKSGEGWVRVEPRSAARALLANRLRQQLFETSNHAPDEFGPWSTYREICLSCRSPRHQDVNLQDDFDRSPDIIWMPAGGSLHVIEVGYGFVEADAMAALDRLLKLYWMTMKPYAHLSVDFVAYVFAHEMSFGEGIHETERRFVDWMDAHYGPFNGIDRIGLPMRVRLTRTVSVSPRDGTVISAIDLETRPTGLAAFAITCERDRY